MSIGPKACIVDGFLLTSPMFPSPRGNPFAELQSLNPHSQSEFTAKTNSFKYSFFPDSLSPDVALANYNSFKTSIINLFLTVLT